MAVFFLKSNNLNITVTISSLNFIDNYISRLYSIIIENLFEKEPHTYALYYTL